MEKEFGHVVILELYDSNIVLAICLDSLETRSTASGSHEVIENY